MLPINPSLAHLPVYQPGRPIEEVARELNLPAHDIIKLASNENPLGPSPMALAAMEKALRWETVPMKSSNSPVTR
jgi:histidinol-phosphate aminotransferase